MHSKFMRLVEADTEHIVVKCEKCGKKVTINLDWETKADAEHMFSFGIRIIEGDAGLEPFEKFFAKLEGGR